MIDGKLVCVGPSEELKQRFGAGYNVQIKINPEKGKHQINEIKLDIVHQLRCELIDEHEVSHL